MYGKKYRYTGGQSLQWIQNRSLLRRENNTKSSPAFLKVLNKKTGTACGTMRLSALS